MPTPKWIVGTADARVGREPFEDPAGMGQDELAVVGGVERADPRIEHLHGVHAGVDLRDQVVRQSTSAIRSQKRCHAAGRAVMSAFVCAKVLEWPPSIAYDASVNGAPGKTNQRHPATQGALDLAESASRT